MDRIDRILNPPKNVILRLWLAAAIIVAAVWLFVTWNERFRAECGDELVEFAVLGVEEGGRMRESFSGEDFSVRMRRLGLSLTAARGEMRKKLATEFFGNEEAASRFVAVPAVWIYARGRTDEEKDRAFESYGKSLFSRERYCFSLADESGFSVQISPALFTIFHAATGEAICALPVLNKPPAPGKFSLKIEARGGNGLWRTLGEIPFSCALKGGNGAPAAPPSPVSPKETLSESELDEAFSLPDRVPAKAELVEFSLPEHARFFSESPDLHDAFARLGVAIEGDERTPARAWSVENVALAAPAGEETRAVSWDEPDALGVNVRFTDGEAFETLKDGVLRSPLAKTLFPGADEAWSVRVALVRRFAFAPEEIRSFKELKLSRVPTTLEFAGTRVRVRAYAEKKYYRTLANGMPALVLEIEGAADLSAPGALFWQPFRVRTDAGEELLPESVVRVRPGVRQYWYLPERKTEKLRVDYAVSRAAILSAEVVPEIRGRDF